MQIHQLNYETFVNEIPQHHSNADHVLIDKFHDENIYLICLTSQKELAGMLCFRDKRPFSLDLKIPDLDKLLPSKAHICEIRLLSVRKEFRNTRVTYGLMQHIGSFCLERGYEMALISGTVRQIKLYEHLGFKRFGDPVGSQEALYYPMYLTVENASTVLFS